MHSNRKTLLVATFAACLGLSFTVSAYTNVNDTLDDGIDLYDDDRYENASDLLLSLVEDRDFRKLDNHDKTLALSHLAYSLMEQGEPSIFLPLSDTLN